MKAKGISILLVLLVAFSVLAGLFSPAVAFADGERYLVTNQGTITNGTGVITESPADLVIGANVVHVTTSGTFTIFLASGTTGTATGNGNSGNCKLKETPVSLVAGSNAIETENPTGHLTITLVAGSDVYWEDVNSWSNTSGGVAGAPFPAVFPATPDNVYFDANSFPESGTTLHIDSSDEVEVTYCNNFDWTGVTNNPTLVGSAQLNIYGDVIMSENMTASSWSAAVICSGDSGNLSIPTSMDSTALFVWGTGTIELQAPLEVWALVVVGGTFITNNYNIDVGTFTNWNSGSEVNIYLGSSVINVSETLSFTNGPYYIDAGTSTIRMGAGGIQGPTVFDVEQTATFYNVEILAAEAGLCAGYDFVVRDMTFHSLSFNSSMSQDITIGTNVDIIVTEANLSGSAGNIHTFATLELDDWSIVKAGGGRVTASYVDLNHSVASPENSWYYKNSTIDEDSTGWAEASGVVRTFPDAALNHAVHERFYLSDGEDIYQSDLDSENAFNGAAGSGVTDLTGMEYWTTLTVLRLGENNISDLTPLSTLTELYWLEINNNNISDLSPLSTLTNMAWVIMGDNNISDISVCEHWPSLLVLSAGNTHVNNLSALSGCTGLAGLLLSNNNISDISALAGLTSMDGLYLNDNNLDSSDLSNLSGMVNLTQLNLANNSISDISALTGMSGLTELRLENNNVTNISCLVGLLGEYDYLYVTGNPLNFHAYDIDIPALEADAVGVYYDPQPVISIIVNPSSKNFGKMYENSSYWSKGSAPTFPLDNTECYFLITNEGSNTINISISASNFTGGLGWTLTSGTPASGTVRMKAGVSGDANEGAMIILTASPASFITSLAGGISKYWELKLETGIFTDGVIKESHITLVAVEDI